MTTTINAQATNGLITTADGSGIVKLQSNGVATNSLGWISFQPGASPTTRSQYNVSSLTRTSAGIYVVNFATSTSDSNYAAVVSGAGNATVGGSYFGLFTTTGGASSTPTTSAFSFTTINNGAYTDVPYSTVVVFGN